MFQLSIIFVSLCIASLGSAQYHDVFEENHNNEIPINDYEFAESHCPSPDLIAPCICSDDHYEVMVKCGRLTSGDDLRTIFERVPGFTFTILYVIDSTMLYFPSSVLHDANVRDINVTDCTFVSLFDVPPTSSHLKNIFINGALFQRGFRWELLSKLNLEGLMLYRTELKKLDSSFKQNVPKNIKYLWLQGNKLSRISREPFENLGNLTMLVMQNEQLTSMTALKFPKSLQMIDLSDNKLRTLPNGFFKNLPNLKMVLLGKNRFTTMNRDLFSGIPAVFVNDNPIVCTCSLKWMVTTKFTEHIYSGTCASPKNLKGAELRTLGALDFNYCG